MDWEGNGYGATPNSANSLFLRLRAKGDKVRIRLVSEPVRYLDTFEDKSTGERTERRKVAWLAISKEVVGGQTSKRVVIFTSGPQVYGVIRDLAESADWGDPTTFDVVVERTEEQGKYYVVTPMPKPMGPLSSDERELILEAAIDWPDIVLKNKSNVAPNGATSEADDDPFAN